MVTSVCTCVCQWVIVPQEAHSASSCHILDTDSESGGENTAGPAHLEVHTGFWSWGFTFVCSYGWEHWSCVVSASVLSGVFHGKNVCRQLTANLWKKEMHRHSSYLGSSASASTQSKTERTLRQQHCAFSQAAMILTLLWVKGHKPEEKSVYHVGNSCHPWQYTVSKMDDLPNWSLAWVNQGKFTVQFLCCFRYKNNICWVLYPVVWWPEGEQREEIRFVGFILP